MSGGGGSTTTQKADPWAGVQPYLRQLYTGAGNLAATGGPQVAQNSGVAPLNQSMTDTLGQIAQRSNGSPLEGTAQNQTNNIANASDWISQLIGGGAAGSDESSNYLKNIMYGSTPGQGVLGSVANGTSAGQMGLGSIINGTNAGQGGLASVINGTNSGQSGLASILNNTNGGQMILGALAQGQGASGSAWQNILSGNTTQDAALNNIIGGNDATSQYLKSVLAGNYLNGNPNLTAAMNAADSDTTRNFQTAVMPQLASQFSLAGRYGSGAQSQGISDATNNLAKQISNTNAGIMNQNYQNERGLQSQAGTSLAQQLLSAIGQRSGNVQNAASSLGSMQQGAAGQFAANVMNAGNQYAGNVSNASNQYAGNVSSASNAYTGNQSGAAGALTNSMLAGAQGLGSYTQAAQGLLSGRQQTAISQLPAMANIDWNNLNNRLNAANILQSQDQSQLTGQNALFSANQQQPYQNMQWLNGILNGSMSLNGQSTTTGGASPLKSAAGGALSGAATGAAIGSVFPGIGTAIGAGVGAVGGAIMGVM